MIWLWTKNKLLIKLVKDKNNQKLLAQWSLDCAEHVLPLFEKKYPNDNRPRKAIEAGRLWIKGKLRVGEVRKAALATHAAARKATNKSAIAVARSCGHAAATAHVITHCTGGPDYALTAVSFLGEKALKSEEEWQLNHLKKILKK